MLLASSSSPPSLDVTKVSPPSSSSSLSLDVSSALSLHSYSSSPSLRVAPLDAAGVGEPTRDEAGEGGSGLVICNRAVER